MFNKQIKTGLVLALAVAAYTGTAQEEKEEKKFDAKIFEEKAEASKLSEEQEKKADENIQKATEIYSELLVYNKEARATTVKSNLDFVSKALTKAEVKLNAREKSLAALENEVLSRSKVLDQQEIPQAAKDQRKRDLVSSFGEQQDYLKYTIKNLNSRIKTFKTRKSLLETEYATLNVNARKRETLVDYDNRKTVEAEDALKKLEDRKKQEALNKYNK